jgi:hypothetical protein
MVVNSGLLLIMRSIGAVLLMLTDTKIFFAYAAGDQLLYLLQKLLRRDFTYWVRVEGVGGLAMSFLARVIVKTLTDFTGVLQFRHPNEMGGAMWLWTMLMALVTPWVAVPVFFGSLTSNSTDTTVIEVLLNDTDSTDTTADAAELDESDDALVFEKSDAWKLLGALTGLWICAFAVFLRFMKKEIRNTFWSMETGTEMMQSAFLLGENDSIKSMLLDNNRTKWKEIEPQVKEWVETGWLRWERDKPEWFDDNWKSKVPEEWVPREGKEEWKRALETVRGSKLGIMSLVARQTLRGVQEDEDGILERDEEEASTGEAAAAAEVVRGGGRVQPVIR